MAQYIVAHNRFPSRDCFRGFAVGTDCVTVYHADILGCCSLSPGMHDSRRWEKECMEGSGSGDDCWVLCFMEASSGEDVPERMDVGLVRGLC